MMIDLNKDQNTTVHCFQPVKKHTERNRAVFMAIDVFASAKCTLIRLLDNINK